MCMQNMYSLANINRNMMIAFYETIECPIRAQLHNSDKHSHTHTKREEDGGVHEFSLVFRTVCKRCVRAPYEMKQQREKKKHTKKYKIK